MISLLISLATAAPTCPGCTTAAVVSRLDNGLTVVVEQQTRTDSVAIMVRYDVGSRDEGPGEHGCAHLFEHLMFEGSEHVPGNAFDQWLTDAGGVNNAWTSEDDTAYHMQIPAGALDLALFLESDRMGYLDAAIDQSNVDNQQDVVLQERRQGYDEPNGRNWDALTTLMFPEGHPYHVPIIGTVADVEGFEAEQVRGFWRKHYRPANAVLIIVGNVEPSYALERVRHWFSDVPDPGPPAPRPTVSSATAPGRNGYIHDRLDEHTLYLTWPTVPRGHADEEALVLASWILDGGRGTRLQDRLFYKRTIANDLGAYAYTSDLAGQFLVMVSAQYTSQSKLERVVLRQLDRLIRTGPTLAELDRAKNAVRSGFLDGLQTPRERADTLLDCIERTGDDPNCLDDRWATVSAVTPADVQQAMARWLVPERLTRLYVLPHGQPVPAGATEVTLP